MKDILEGLELMIDFFAMIIQFTLVFFLCTGIWLTVSWLYNAMFGG